ncbi:hypothetical protein HNR74_004540 [Flammeovirga kamogawensis]|nr:hypothetical protein [Flammeovirga kamogawensis]
MTRQFKKGHILFIHHRETTLVTRIFMLSKEDTESAYMK